MKKTLTTFIPFLFLIALWSIFFSTFKFFLWNDVHLTLNVDLPTIAGYLSLGTALSYLVGGAFAYSFTKKYYLLFLSIFTALITAGIFLFGFQSKILFGITVVIIGFFYGLWTVMRNVIISMEIEKTGLSDTLVNGIAGIVFIVFIIGGSILGSLLFEYFHDKGFFCLLLFLLLAFFVSHFLNYDKIQFSYLFKKGLQAYLKEKKRNVHTAISSYIPELKYVIYNYFPLLISSSLLWATSSAISQQAIEHSVKHFGILPSEASYILLYCAVGVIIGNIISVKLETKRWISFTVFSLLYALMIFVFPFLAFSYFYTTILALFIGIFFGVCANLVDSFYLLELAQENKKEYGASTYGLTVSIVIFSVMMITSATNRYFGLEVSTSLTGFLVILGTTYLIYYIYKAKKWN